MASIERARDVLGYEPSTARGITLGTELEAAADSIECCVGPLRSKT